MLVNTILVQQRKRTWLMFLPSKAFRLVVGYSEQRSSLLLPSYLEEWEEVKHAIGSLTYIALYVTDYHPVIFYREIIYFFLTITSMKKTCFFTSS